MKKTMLICAPVTSRSGYGAHARDLVTSFINHDKYDINILDVPWGSCPRNALDKNNQNDKLLLDRILMNPLNLITNPIMYVKAKAVLDFFSVARFTRDDAP